LLVDVLVLGLVDVLVLLSFFSWLVLGWWMSWFFLLVLSLAGGCLSSML